MLHCSMTLILFKGIYSYDIKNNRARIDYTLEDKEHPEHYLYLQSLQRYDTVSIVVVVRT